VVSAPRLPMLRGGYEQYIPLAGILVSLSPDALRPLPIFLMFPSHSFTSRSHIPFPQKRPFPTQIRGPFFQSIIPFFLPSSLLFPGLRSGLFFFFPKSLFFLLLSQLCLSMLWDYRHATLLKRGFSFALGYFFFARFLFFRFSSLLGDPPPPTPSTRLSFTPDSLFYLATTFLFFEHGIASGAPSPFVGGLLFLSPHCSLFVIPTKVFLPFSSSSKVGVFSYPVQNPVFSVWFFPAHPFFNFSLR